MKAKNREHKEGEDEEEVKEGELKFKITAVYWCLSQIMRNYPPRNLAELIGVLDTARMCAEAYGEALQKSGLREAVEYILGTSISDYLRQCRSIENQNGGLVNEVLKEEFECYMKLLLIIQTQVPPSEKEEYPIA